jgi:hypothetical protein
LKHHTSKLSTFLDLSHVLTFGFRGEALSSLCALSDELNVVTCTANQGGLGGRIELDGLGCVKQVTKVARPVRVVVICYTRINDLTHVSDFFVLCMAWYSGEQQSSLQIFSSHFL